MTATPARAALDELDALLAAATPGEWIVDDDADVVVATDPDSYLATGTSFADAALIVALRNAAPELLARLRRAEAANRAAYALAEEWQNRPGAAGDDYASGVTTGERRCGAALTVALRTVLDEALGVAK